MALIAAFLFGALIGWLRAGLRGGKTADRLQWAAVHGLILALVTLFAGLILARTGAL